MWGFMQHHHEPCVTTVLPVLGCPCASSPSAPVLRCTGFIRLVALDVQVLEKIYPGRPIVGDLYEVCNMSRAALRRQRAQA